MTPGRAAALCLILGPLVSLGCAPSVPAPYLKDRARVPGYEWPPRAVEGEAEPNAGKPSPEPHRARQAKAAQAKEKRLVPFVEPSQVLGDPDQECLAELRSLGVQFQPLRELRGVRTPVHVESRLGGVEYYVQGGSPLRMDCRFAVTLANLGPLLSHHEVVRVRYSGAYVYKTAPSGRLSHHAYGVAIDLHDFETRHGRLTVKHDFRKGAGCGRRVPRLNRLACDLRRQGIFEELLTPDFNRAHRDHLHLSIPRR